ncbi:hypothetical protein [uncultured Dysgonomonas sp.]|uniref:Adhesin domain-containing protein n=1 Tax=uncultured Dysgonomonas sp. TaxID=206096 RepID=A0A212JEU7_9BACT|nr:hypothetical protein [uncultured Dysgonomonas sp.]SBV97940.1 conserved exported hypothetical protein [uncultured Dysgonomonas sp.]
MRLTTKIVLGIIAAVFLSAIGYICYLSLSYDGEKKTGLILKEETAGIDISGQKVIEIYADTIPMKDGRGNKDRYYVIFDGHINIQPVTNEGEKGKLEIPEQLKEYLEISTLHDKTILRVKTAELLADHYKNEIPYPAAIRGLNITVYADSCVDIRSRVDGLRANVQGLKAGSINIDILRGDLNIENCEADIITPIIRDWGSFVMKNSKTKVFNADLDYLQNWRIEQCDIDTENLTGSGNHNIILPASECRVMNWNPKNEKASLNVSLGSDTARVVFP